MPGSGGTTVLDNPREKFGRRIFLSLLLVTTIPFCAFALISYLELKNILMSQGEELQREKIRDTGSLIVNVLEGIETQLRLYQSDDGQRNYLLDRTVDILRLTEVDFYWSSQSGTIEKMLVEAYGGGRLTQDKLTQHLQSGLGALFVDESRSPPEINYAVRGNGRVVLATVSLDEHLRRLSKWADFFLVTRTGKIIASSVEETDTSWLIGLSAEKNSGQFNHQSAGVNWNYRYASLFLMQRFAADSIFVVARIDSESTLQSLTRYKWIFVTSLTLILALIILLSALQIRKKLKPMLHLVEAANAIAEKKFDFEFDQSIKGELGILARTMGDMSSQLSAQFAYLKLLSDIDKYTMSDAETTTVVTRITRDLRAALGCNYIAILFVNQVENNLVALVEVSSEEARPRVKVPSGISTHMLNNLSAPLDDVVAVRSELAGILGRVTARDVESLSVQLLRNEETVTGVLMLSCVGEDVNKERRLISELAMHISIALNAKMRERTHRKLAFWDTLTGAPNRRFFETELVDAANSAVQAGIGGAVFFLDLDHFKKINDTLGHEFGDELLRFAYERIKLTLPDGAMCARFGGDEFVLLVPGFDRKSALSLLANRLIGSLSEPFDVRSHSVYVGASIGVACFPEHGTSVEELLRCADLAMYESKQSGRGRFTIYSSKTDNRFLERAKLEEALRLALRSEQLTVHYQPQVCCETGDVVGVEALARWHDEEFGWVSPSVFIPVAEDIGLVEKIGDWVLIRSCLDILELAKRTGVMLRLGVNFSSIQFSQDRVYEKLMSILDGCKFPANFFDVEMTESVVMEDFRRVVVTLEKLMQSGVSVSIDDFGTGYSSLSYLHKLPLTRVKVDRAFISNVNSDDQKSALVKAIISMNRSLGLITLAEGVETEEEWQWLKAEECDEIQGYYFSKPLAIDALETYIREIQHIHNKVVGH